MQEDGINKPSGREKEIDLIELAGNIWKERRLVLRTLGIFLAIGLLVAFGSTNEYRSEVRLLPELRNEEGGASGLLNRFSGLSGLMGIDMGMMGGIDAIGPQLYPEVLKSTPFMLHIMNTRVEIPSLDTTATVYCYMTELKKTSLMGYIGKFTVGLPGTIMNLFRKREESLPGGSGGIQDPIRITKRQYEIIEELQDRIRAGADQKTGVISVSAEFPDPVLAARIAGASIDYLQEYITGYRTTKAYNDLDFITGQYDRARRDFEKAQQALATFRDENRNINSARVQSGEERLQADYNLAFNVYNSLAQQLEQARIRVQEETPVYTQLDPVKIPAEKSKPRRMVILSVFCILSVTLSILWIVTKSLFTR